MMDRILLIFLYFFVSLIPILFLKLKRKEIPIRSFVLIWILSISGAFTGGYFGARVYSVIHPENTFSLYFISALIFSVLFSRVFIKFQEIPSEW